MCPFPPQMGDKTLAQSAQMYHYQHRKQQMLSVGQSVLFLSFLYLFFISSNHFLWTHHSVSSPQSQTRTEHAWTRDDLGWRRSGRRLHGVRVSGTRAGELRRVSALTAASLTHRWAASVITARSSFMCNGSNNISVYSCSHSNGEIRDRMWPVGTFTLSLNPDRGNVFSPLQTGEMEVKNPLFDDSNLQYQGNHKWMSNTHTRTHTHFVLRWLHAWRTWPSGLFCSTFIQLFSFFSVFLHLIILSTSVFPQPPQWDLGSCLG